MLKDNAKPTADCSPDVMQHRQQGNCHNRGQRQHCTQEHYLHAGQRHATNTRNGDKTPILERSVDNVEVINIYELCKCPTKVELCHHCKVKATSVQPVEITICDTISNDNKRVFLWMEKGHI